MALKSEINGKFFDFADIIIKTEFGTYSGVTSINYSSSVERGSVYGTSRRKIGRTGGQVSHEASMTMTKESYADLIDGLSSVADGRGYGTVPFTITVLYADGNAAVVKDVLSNVLIDGDSDAHGEGTERLTVDVTLNVMRITRDGNSLI